MSMDLIAGTVILTSVFLLVVGVGGVMYGRSPRGQLGTAEGPQRARMVLAILLVVFFLGITNVFIITQQYNLAFVNLTAGIALAALQYFAGASRAAATNGESDGVSTESTDVGRER